MANWTPDMDAFAKQALLEEVAKKGEGRYINALNRINEKFSTTFTRNALSGRAERQGWKGPTKFSARVKIQRQHKPKFTGDRSRRQAQRTRSEQEIQLRKVRERPFVNHNATSVSIDELGFAVCHWPLDVSKKIRTRNGFDVRWETRYCGQPCSGRYCDEHAAVAYRPGGQR